MKKLLTLLALMSLTILFSCEKDEVKAVLNKDVVPPSVPSTGWEAKAVTEENTSENVTFKWQKADYGINTVITYTLQMDVAGREFSGAVSLGTTTADSLSISLGQLNELLINTLNLPVNEESLLELKLNAFINSPDTLVDHNDETESPVSQIAVTTWKKIVPPPTDPLTLWVPGAYQGWSPATAPVISRVGEGLYEGYVYMNVGDYYKFTSHPDWDHINYGNAGDGNLTPDGLAEGLKVDAPGFYKFNVNTKDMTYTAVLIETWGLIGTASPGSWDVSTAMDFDEATGLWTKTIDLAAGALKFRANNGWDINYGPQDSNALVGNLTQTDAAIDIKEAGNYTISLDFNTTTESLLYKYTVTKN
ncbi:MAG TPA: SusE domain-containing protein [Cytophagales bacterium]|nr:SusE domain-containing protein [Cytophagales bacterium]